MRQVVVFPRGQLSPKDKERFSKADILAVEADDPSKVVTMLPSCGVLNPDDLLVCAARVILASGDYVKIEFGKAIANAIIKARP